MTGLSATDPGLSDGLGNINYGTITTSMPHTITQTWNAAGVTFTGLKVAITSTASAAASLAADFQVDGTSVWKVTKAGVMTLAGTKTFTKSTTNLTISDSSDGYAYVLAYGLRGVNADAGIGDFGLTEPTTSKPVRVTIADDTGLAWRATNVTAGALRTMLISNAAATLSLRNSTTAQTFEVYGTYTDASNYERLSLTHTNGTGSVIAVQTAGTGGDDLSLRLTPAGTGAVVSAFSMRILDGTAIPAGGTAGAGYKLSSTTNLGLFFGSGAPTLSAAQGSLYIRTDGSSSSTRFYVNTNGTTGWTNVTTAT